jgi:glycosyltransferase involved in cell wall biosynthesis
MKPRAVVVHPPFGPYGGGELLAAWVVQSLARDYAVTLVCIDPVDWTQVDARFGTTLADAGVTVRTPSPAWRRILHVWPPRADLLRRALLERLSAQLVPFEPGDVWIGTYNETRLPQPGLQYVNWPTPGMLTDAELDGIGASPRLRREYLKLCRSLAGPQLVEHRQNVTLVNSRFTAAAWQQIHGLPAAVVYPPVPPLATGRPWSERADRVVCLGRLFPGKGIERVVAVVAGVRAQGATLTLAVAGKWDCEAQERRRLEQFLRERPWIELHENASRSSLAALLASSRYGVHGMMHEPFGIAVAELQDSGAITFAPASGGPPEIIEDERLLYRDVSDGVDKLMRVWRDPALQDELRQQAATRIGRFSPTRFMQHIRAEVADAVGRRLAS